MTSSDANTAAPVEKIALRPKPGGYIVPVVFFVGFYLYVRLIIEPQYIYHSFGIYTNYPAFSADWLFLKQSLSLAAGPVQYVAGFLSQLFYYRWAGAMVVMLVAFLICRASKVLAASAGGAGFAFTFLPALAVLMLYNRYTHYLSSLLALAAALWFSVVYVKVPVRRAWLRLVVFLLMFVLLYYIAGAASLVFAALAVMHEMFGRRRLLLGILIALSALHTVWLEGASFFCLTAHDAYLLFLPLSLEEWLQRDRLAEAILTGIYLFVPMLVAGSSIRRYLLRKEAEQSKPNRKKAGRKKRSPLLQSRRFRIAVETLTLAVVFSAGVYFSYDGFRKKTLQILHFSNHRMWDRVLDTARSVPAGHYDFFLNHQVDRALYHTGRLGDEMFSFPQSRPALLLLTNDVPNRATTYWMAGDTSLEMGNVNLAERWAYEAIETQGAFPLILEKLAFICLAKDRTLAARVLLNRMRKDLIYRSRARAFLRRLDEDPRLENDRWMQQLRELRWTEDQPFDFRSEGRMLQDILEANRHNKMAFEYLMAFYLLTCRPDKVAENLYRLDDFDYTEIPRHYQEAVMVYASISKKKVPLYGRQMSPRTIQCYNEFINRYSSFRADKQAAFEALRRDFGDTYFFYHIFKASGV